jgi:ubiquinone/menaquinone biosynthesis C-methylase UbiE
MSDSSESGNSSRWKMAQEYEAAWWQNVTDIYDTDYLVRFASDIEEMLLKTDLDTSGADVLEIGAGPVGIVSYLGCRRRVASDPLDSLFESQAAYRTHREQARQRGVEYIEAKGEKLPFSDSEFDLLITDNVLDHTESPDRILTEARRVLKAGGVMYLRVNVYHFWGRFIRRLMELAVIDKGHPYTFSSKKLKNMAEMHGFQILSSRSASFFDSWKKDWSRALAGNRKALVQALICVSRAHQELLLRRQ